MNESFIESPRFPEDISYGSSVGKSYITIVNTSKSGEEQRTGVIDEPFKEFEVSHGVKTQEQMQKLEEFFDGVMGRLYAFRYKNWNDFHCPVERSAIRNDGTNLAGNGTFNLYKKFGFVNNPRYKRIYKPVAGKIKIFLNGVETTFFTCDYTKGIVTLTPTKFSNTDIVTWSGEFDTPVRLDTDIARFNNTTFNSYEWNQIRLKEITP